MAMDSGSGNSTEKEASSRPVLITEGMAKRVGFGDIMKRKRKMSLLVGMGVTTLEGKGREEEEAKRNRKESKKKGKQANNDDSGRKSL